MLNEAVWSLFTPRFLAVYRRRFKKAEFKQLLFRMRFSGVKNLLFSKQKADSSLCSE
jgi:hypothetical protein